MRILSTIKVSLRALRRNALRSVLTALGIIIGVAAVIAMVSIGNGAKAQVESAIASLGQNIISIFPGNATSGGVRGGFGSASTLTIEDALAIRGQISGVVNLSPEMRDRTQILANGLNWNSQILGEDVSYLDIRLWAVIEGAMFTEADVRSAAKVCVIGRTVADQLFQGMDPVGQTLRIRNIPFKVVGLLARKGFNYFGQDQDDAVIVPYTSHLKRIARRPFLNSIIVQAESPDQMTRIQQDITDLLLQRRNGREQDFVVRNQAELAEAATATTKTMTVLLGAIAGVSLVVGGIGIMNIMLVSVTERTPRDWHSLGGRGARPRCAPAVSHRGDHPEPHGRRVGNHARSRQFETNFPAEQLAGAGFDQRDCRRIRIQRGHRRILRLLSRAQSRPARSHRSAALRVIIGAALRPDSGKHKSRRRGDWHQPRSADFRREIPSAWPQPSWLHAMLVGTKSAKSRPNHNSTMKPTTKTLSLVLAASVAGGAIFALGNAQATAGINGEVLFAIVVSISVLLFAAYDYSRRIESLRARAPLFRPCLPSGTARRSTAYGVGRVRRSAIVERVA